MFIFPPGLGNAGFHGVATDQRTQSSVAVNAGKGRAFVYGHDLRMRVGDLRMEFPYIAAQAQDAVTVDATEVGLDEIACDEVGVFCRDALVL